MMDIHGKRESRETSMSMRVPRQLVFILIVSTAILLVAFLLGLVSGTRPARATGLIYVNVDASGSNDGTNWDDAYTDLQEALSCVVSGDEIWVAAGIYKPGTLVTHTFQMTSGVAIYGGFDATETLRDQRDWETNITVLSGDIDNNDTIDADGVVTNTESITGTNSYHVVTCSGSNNQTILDGFTITGGDGKGYWQDTAGGGIYNVGGSPNLANLIFKGNKAFSGGGMHNYDNANPTLTNVTFKSNWALGGGGMSNVKDSSPALNNITFYKNLAESGGGLHNLYSSNTILQDVFFIANTAEDRGGGMYNENSKPMLNNVTFSGNHAKAGGGMINIFSHDGPTLRNVFFTGNSALQGGGGIYNYDMSSPELTNVIFSGNSSGGGGGMLNIEWSNPKLTHVAFIGNSSTGAGGGIDNSYECYPVLTNVVLSGNSAYKGGGIFNGSSRPILTNVTVSGNYASSWGGGMYNGKSDAIVLNSIFWNNQDMSGIGTITATIYNKFGESTPVFSYTLVQASGGSGPGWDSRAGKDGGNNIDSDPLFLEPIYPITTTTSGNLRLVAGSPAIDMGDNSAITTGTDLDGNQRIIDGDGDGTSTVDMGAHEALIHYADLSITITNRVETIPDGETLTYTITAANAGPDGVTGAIVSGTIPAELVDVSWICIAESGSSCSAGGSGNTFTDTVDLTTSGQVTYTLLGTVSQDATGDIAVTIMVTPPVDAVDPDTSNNIATDTTEVVIPPPDRFEVFLPLIRDDE